jgi:predicted TPR repeat methyltransferase
MGFEQRYMDGGYLEQNPGWSLEDASWKAGMIARLLTAHQVTFNSAVEVGCGAGGVLHWLHKQYPELSFAGYDISPQAIAMARQFKQDTLQFYQEDFLQKETAQQDLVLVIDVIEHVPDFYGFLSKLREKGKQFVFHIPLDMSCRTLMKPHVLLQQRQAVGHLHYFTKDLVWWALQDCGYQIKQWRYTKPRIDIDKPESIKRAVKKILRNASFSLSKKRSVQLWGGYSVLILAE